MFSRSFLACSRFFFSSEAARSLAISERFSSSAVCFSASSNDFASASALFLSSRSILLHAPEGLRPVEALVGQVLDELVELLQRRLHLRALLALAQLLRRLLEQLDVVRGHLHRVDGGRMRRRGRRLHGHVEERDRGDARGGRGGAQEVARERDGGGVARVEALGVRAGVVDGDLHERGPLLRRLERERVGEPALEAVVLVEGDGARAGREAAKHREGHGGDDHRRRAREDLPGVPVRERGGQDLADGERPGGDGERDRQRRGQDAEGPREPQAKLDHGGRPPDVPKLLSAEIAHVSCRSCAATRTARSAPARDIVPADGWRARKFLARGPGERTQAR